MPIFTSVPAIESQYRAKAWVPIDDHHTLVWEPNWHPTEALADENRRGWKGRVPPSGMREAGGNPLDRRPLCSQPSRTIIGSIASASARRTSQESRSLRRCRTRLSRRAWGRSSTARVSIWARPTSASSTCASGCSTRRCACATGARSLPGVFDPVAYRRRGCQLVVPRDADWLEASRSSSRFEVRASEPGLPEEFTRLKAWTITGVIPIHRNRP